MGSRNGRGGSRVRCDRQSLEGFKKIDLRMMRTADAVRPAAVVRQNGSAAG